MKYITMSIIAVILASILSITAFLYDEKSLAWFSLIVAFFNLIVLVILYLGERK